MTTMLCAFLVFVVGCAQTGAESNEGTRFAFALSPNDIVYYHAELILNARQTTDVTITTSSSSETVTVPGNWSYFYDIDYSMRAITDIEDKGIYITADEPITAHVAPMSSGNHGNHMTDANLLRPTTESSLEYSLAGYHDMSTSSRPMSYYMVVATEDNTYVHVLYTDDIGVEDEHFTLQRFDVFTKDTFHENQTEIDFTGTRVVANKPVFVKSGNGCANNYAQGGHTVSRHIVESMPPLSQLGVDYTSFPLHFGGYGGYEVRVIAVEDSTSVTVPAFSTSLILNMGEYHVINTFDTRLAFKVACSKPCMVVQYVRGLREGGDADFHMGAFMAILISDERASSHLIFTVPRIIDLAISTKAAISININTFPVTGLYLNDTSLADLDWQPVEESEMWSGTVEIETGFYQLYSVVSAERFTAYLYVVYGGWYAVGLPVGFADAIVPTEPPTTITTPPTTTPPTTTSPTTPPGGQPPQYRVVLFGNFTSETGEDFSTACAQALRENFQIKVVTMVPGLNDMFGQNLCGYVGSGDVSIVSSSSMLVTSGNAGVTDVSYRLEAASHVTISNLTSCAGELSIYLQDFDNWGRPVIPPASGCPDAVFDPDFFFEGPPEDNWICLGQNALTELVSELQVDAPLYSLSVYDNFTTRNDEELDPTCGYDYQQAWQTKASEMVIILNGEITADRLCTGGSDKFSVVISSASFLPEGSKGSLTSTFFMRLTYDHLSFDDVHSCTAEMFIFLAYHTNWGSLPLLPQQPGCPELLFEPPQFYHNGESWQCL